MAQIGINATGQDLITTPTLVEAPIVVSTAGGALVVQGAGGSTATSGFTCTQINGGGAVPTITGVTHCVASAPLGHDIGGSFTLTIDGTGVAAGTIATVAFGTALPAAPVAVFTSAFDSTTTVNVTTVYTKALATTGFAISNSASIAPTQVVNVQYLVMAS
jgi:hypothetical protein